jgi:hypothetical protein
MDANWLTAIGTLVLAVIAVFHDFLRGFFWKPNLDCVMEMKHPDCHWTRLEGTGSSYISFYFIFEVVNNGRVAAKNVEVLISDVKKKIGDEYKILDGFFPVNLLWSFLSELRGIDAQGRQVISPKLFCDYISPKTSKHCNLGHIHDPAYSDLEVEEKKKKELAWSNNLKQGETTFIFDVSFRSHRRGYIVEPGTYRFRIQVGCENAKSISKEFEMTISGKWHTSEARMLGEGFAIKELKHTRLRKLAGYVYSANIIY